MQVDPTVCKGLQGRRTWTSVFLILKDGDVLNSSLQIGHSWPLCVRTRLRVVRSRERNWCLFMLGQSKNVVVYET